MPRGTFPATLLQSLRAEIGQTADTAAASQSDTSNLWLMQSKQMWLAALRDWPFLEKRWDLTIIPGQRYITFPILDSIGEQPTPINVERPFQVETLFGTIYYDVDYGIGAQEFNYLNSDLG